MAGLARALDPALPAARRGESLSRKALRVLASTPGLTVTLVGMRKKRYVDDPLAVMGWEPLPDVMPAYAALEDARA